MTDLTYNFCAGPAGLPKAVMERAKSEFLDWEGIGASVMEISHRSSEYTKLAQVAESNLRQLLNISNEYAVLFMQGGASLQFASIPMSLLHPGSTAEYLSNGIWSNKAAKEAKRYGKVTDLNVLEVGQDGVRGISDSSCWKRVANAAYTHYTPNETIDGFRFPEVVDSESPLIADMSSCILSETINVDDFDLIYSGAQKNIGPAGMTIVIVKRSLFQQMKFAQVPAILNYQEQDKHGSMINTPPTYTWYLASLVFEWIIEQGGVEQMQKQAVERASLLYRFIDEDDFYTNPIAIPNRSRMNIPFVLKDDGLDQLFFEGAEARNLIGLKGHRSVGGMRASLYNSMPVEGVHALIEYMNEFKHQYG